MIYILTLIISVLFVFNLWRDLRNLWNAFLFLATLGMLYFSALELAFEHSDILYPLLLLVLVAVPFVIVFLGIFLVINGFVILQKEGKTLGNSLSFLLGLSLLGYMVLAFLGIRFGQYLALQLPILYYIFIVIFFLSFLPLFFWPFSSIPCSIIFCLKSGIMTTSSSTVRIFGRGEGNATFA